MSVSDWHETASANSNINRIRPAADVQESVRRFTTILKIPVKLIPRGHIDSAVTTSGSQSVLGEIRDYPFDQRTHFFGNL